MSDLIIQPGGLTQASSLNGYAKKAINKLIPEWERKHGKLQLLEKKSLELGRIFLGSPIEYDAIFTLSGKNQLLLVEVALGGCSDKTLAAGPFRKIMLDIFRLWNAQEFIGPGQLYTVAHRYLIVREKSVRDLLYKRKEKWVQRTLSQAGVEVCDPSFTPIEVEDIKAQLKRSDVSIAR